MFDDLFNILIVAALIVVAIFVLGMILARLYRRASKEVSFVRTGFGGQKVIVNGGALVLPVLHEIIQVNMNTLRLEVRRTNEQALITKDRMRVDVQAEFYVRVQPTAESIANAAQTLGRRTMEPAALKELVEGKFVDALRAVAAEMAMEELHEQRVNFVQKVQAAVSEDILKNGLELESVSLTGLDQTNREFFNADNVFDAEGLTKMTQAIEDRRKTRNDIEQSTQVAIARKNLEAQTEQYQIHRDTEYARLSNEREIAIRVDQQNAEIESQRALRATESEAARTLSRQQIREAAIKADQAIALSEADSNIAVAQKSEAQSEADARANVARALSAKAAEEVETARQTEVAERTKRIQLIEAAQEAEKASINIVVASDAEKQAAKNRAEAARTLAEGEAEAAKLKAAATEVTYSVEAAGKQALNEAANQLSPEQIAMNVRMALIQALPQIIAESVKPMENIEGIKILHVDGLNGGGGNGYANGHEGGNGIADQAVDAALRYRSQAPLIDALLSELGLKGGSLNGLVSSVVAPSLETPAAPPAKPTK
ncbi:MAG: flotillin family protein [Devosia sp.]|uniref:flotillin family protein n=1 Tax=Devosia sp. 66-22 TaxID=1895753 RepID=UPI000928E8C0|nr:flotillin domain-containing protein [Devosia sp. 66-22]MBN9348435.1 flotillin family protein [Devosia sp.]OJX54526.1 MAG: flotillin [Devosia sp. 66-22]